MIGVWLIQLGTPKSPDPKDCGIFLKEFLMDEDVIDIPWIFRFPLVHFCIVPFRKYKSAKAYQSIWTKDGSPLRFYSEKLWDGVRGHLKSEAMVELSMRYGSPSIPETAKKFEKAGVREIIVLPLYPQYALASTETSLKLVRKSVASGTRLHEIPYFYQEDFYRRSLRESAKGFDLKSFDHFLMSYHGLPIRQVEKVSADLNYVTHCDVTTKNLVQDLNLPEEKVTMCFQSRLGSTPWIQPFTDKVIEDLARKGKKRMAVFCPSFVADCLETLEEISIRNNELFRSFGGDELKLIPSLNAEPYWIEALAGFLKSRIAALNP